MKHELTVLESGSRKTTAFVNEDGEVREKSGNFRTEMNIEVTCSCGAEFGGYDQEAIEHLKNPDQTYCDLHDETFRKDEKCPECVEEGGHQDGGGSIRNREHSPEQRIK